jgi:hypothetical protein
VFAADRLENLPGPIALMRMMAAMVDLFCDSFAMVPSRIVLASAESLITHFADTLAALRNAHPPQPFAHRAPQLHLARPRPQSLSLQIEQDQAGQQ